MMLIHGVSQPGHNLTPTAANAAKVFAESPSKPMCYYKPDQNQVCKLHVYHYTGAFRCDMWSCAC